MVDGSGDVGTAYDGVASVSSVSSPALKVSSAALITFAVVVHANLEETTKFKIYSELAMVYEDEHGKYLNLEYL